MDILLTSFSMKELIIEPTHILENVSSCIDLIFTNQPNIVLESEVHSSLHLKCHHQIIYWKLNLKIDYLSQYTCEIWDYFKAETDLINHSIENAYRSNLFLGKNVHEQVEIFNQTALNIFHNFIPNKTILCYNRHPPCISERKNKSLIKKKMASLVVNRNFLILTILL